MICISPEKYPLFDGDPYDGSGKLLSIRRQRFHSAVSAAIGRSAPGMNPP